MYILTSARFYLYRSAQVLNSGKIATLMICKQLFACEMVCVAL